MKLPVDAVELIPHRGAMKLIGRFLESDGNAAAAETVIPVDSPFVVAGGGWVERSVLIELVAQTYAAAKTHKDMLDGKAERSGYLVGISRAAFYGNALAGLRIVIEVETDSSFDDFYLAAGRIKQADTLLAEVMLKIWLSPEGQDAQS